MPAVRKLIGESLGLNGMTADDVRTRGDQRDAYTISARIILSARIERLGLASPCIACQHITQRCVACHHQRELLDICRMASAHAMPAFSLGKAVTAVRRIEIRVMLQRQSKTLCADVRS